MVNIEQLFENNLAMVQEDNPERPYQEQLSAAAEITAEEVSGIVYRIQEKRWAGHVDDVNKMHFDEPKPNFDYSGAASGSYSDIVRD